MNTIVLFLEYAAGIALMIWGINNSDRHWYKGKINRWDVVWVGAGVIMVRCLWIAVSNCF